MRVFGLIGAILSWVILILPLVASWVLRLPKHRVVFYTTAICMLLMGVLSLSLLVGYASGDWDMKVSGPGSLIFPSFIFWVAASRFTAFLQEERKHSSSRVGATDSTQQAPKVPPVDGGTSLPSGTTSSNFLCLGFPKSYVARSMNSACANFVGGCTRDSSRRCGGG